MIRVNILTPQQAEKLGLKKTSQNSGSGIKAVGCIVEGKHGEEGKIVEQMILRENNETELIFMEKEREKDLKNRGQFSEYVKQFKKIPEELK